MGAPVCGQLFNFLQIVAFDAVEFFNGGAQAKVPDREDIRAFERENKKHLGGPGTDAFDFYQLSFDFIIGLFFQLVEGETARGDRLGNVPNVVGFDLEKPTEREFLDCDDENFFRFRLGGKRAKNRLKILSAAFIDNCWPVTISTRSRKRSPRLP